MRTISNFDGDAEAGSTPPRKQVSRTRQDRTRPALAAQETVTELSDYSTMSETRLPRSTRQWKPSKHVMRRQELRIARDIAGRNCAGRMRRREEQTG